jgi:hypothetical protein
MLRIRSLASLILSISVFASLSFATTFRRLDLVPVQSEECLGGLYLPAISEQGERFAVPNCYGDLVFVFNHEGKLERSFPLLQGPSRYQLEAMIFNAEGDGLYVSISGDQGWIRMLRLDLTDGSTIEVDRYYNSDYSNQDWDLDTQTKVLYSTRSQCNGSPLAAFDSKGKRQKILASGIENGCIRSLGTGSLRILGDGKILSFNSLLQKKQDQATLISKIPKFEFPSFQNTKWRELDHLDSFYADSKSIIGICGRARCAQNEARAFLTKIDISSGKQSFLTIPNSCSEQGFGIQISKDAPVMLCATYNQFSIFDIEKNKEIAAVSTSNAQSDYVIRKINGKLFIAFANGYGKVERYSVYIEE